MARSVINGSVLGLLCAVRRSQPIDLLADGRAKYNDVTLTSAIEAQRVLPVLLQRAGYCFYNTVNTVSI